jgi:dienelactone hydrolase
MKVFCMAGELKRLLVLRALAIFGLAMLASILPAQGDEPQNVARFSIPQPGVQFSARDTLQLDEDPVEDCQECLRGLRWTPAEFTVECEPAESGYGDLLVRFPTPIVTGDAVNDRVSAEFYLAKNEDRQLIRARCVIVVHESGRGMTVGRIFAKGLSAQGLHALLVHLPGYGARRSAQSGRPQMILSGMKQAVADVRRARDAAVEFPFVDASVIGIQGTSLGGFITSTASGLDSNHRAFNRVFILLAGGHLHDVVLKGAKDAAKVRERLESIGVTGDQVKELARPVEPLRVAHRLDPRTTWLYSGKYDDVVPPACSFALAEAAKLPKEHHVELPADHYSGVIFLPVVINEIKTRMITDIP